MTGWSRPWNTPQPTARAPVARWLASGHTPPQTPRLSLVLAYRLADYLDQHGRRAHRSVIPSALFWTAAARFAAPGDLEALARAAAGRGLLRDAARLRKRAAAHGDTRAAAALVKSLHSLHPADSAPARWAAAHASLHDPAAVTELLEELREAGAVAQAAVLLARDPAAHASLDNPAAVAMLLQGLREAGAGAQVAGTGLRRRRARQPPRARPPSPSCWRGSAGGGRRCPGSAGAVCP